MALPTLDIPLRRAGIAALGAAGRDWREAMLCRGVAAANAF